MRGRKCGVERPKASATNTGKSARFSIPARFVRTGLLDLVSKDKAVGFFWQLVEVDANQPMKSANGVVMGRTNIGIRWQVILPNDSKTHIVR